MRLFRYKEDRLPIILFLSLFLLDVLAFVKIQSPILLVAWMLVGLLPKMFICSWNHHHQHLPTFYQTGLNRVLEFVYAFQTGITTNAWVLHHNLGHHINYLDQSKDESGWKRKDGSLMGEVEYTFVIALTGYLRAFRVGRRHPKYQRSFIGMGTIVFFSVVILTAHDWDNAVIIFLVPMICGYLVTCWHTYSHHAGLDTDDHYLASHNIMHKWYNLLTGNLGYHTAHHIKPGLHWSKLPEFHATIADKIPSHLYVEPFAPIRWLPSGVQKN